MQNTVQKIADLIDHLRMESLEEQHKCFYCGGDHKTVECESPHRKAFHLSLVAVNAAVQAEMMEEDLGQDDLQFENRKYVEPTRTPYMFEKWEELAF